MVRYRIWLSSLSDLPFVSGLRVYPVVDEDGLSVIVIGDSEDIQYFCDELAFSGNLLMASVDEDVGECGEYIMVSPMVSHLEMDGSLMFLHPMSPRFSECMAPGITIKPLDFRLHNGVWFEHPEIGRILGWFGRYRICGDREIVRDLYVNGFSSLRGMGLGVALKVST